MPADFRIEATQKRARAGRLLTPHGEIETPVFMPVGTVASVKGVSQDILEELGVQILPEEDELKFDFDILDATKIIPEDLIPVRRIGKMVLNRNPENYFAETEQVAFMTSNVVPGIRLGYRVAAGPVPASHCKALFALRQLLGLEHRVPIVSQPFGEAGWQARRDLLCLRIGSRTAPPRSPYRRPCRIRFSRTVAVGSAPDRWATIPIRCRTCPGRASTSIPSTRAVPESGLASDVRILTAVLLPAPLGPSRP